MLNLKLPADVEEVLNDLSRENGLSTSDYVLDLIREHIGDLEDARIADERRREMKDGLAEKIPLSDMLKKYGVDH